MPAQTPEELDTIFQQAITSGDLDAIMALYEPGAVFANQSGELSSGIDAVRREIAPFAAMKPDFKLQVEKVITAGDIAVLYSKWSMTTPAQMSGRSVEVARRQADGTCLFVVDDPFAVVA